MGLAKIYQYTKFEVSSFIRFKFTEGVAKLINSFWTLTTSHLGVFCHQ